MLFSLNLTKSSARNAKNVMKLGALNTLMTHSDPIHVLMASNLMMRNPVVTMRNSKDSPCFGVEALN